MKSLVKALSGLLLVALMVFAGFPGVANAASTFAGSWIDNAGDQITVTESENIITSVKFSNGRGPFQGFEVGLYAPVISVNFSDDIKVTGVLAGNNIQWSNGTTWVRK